MDLGFVGIVGVGRALVCRRIRIAGGGAGEDQVFSVEASRTRRSGRNWDHRRRAAAAVCRSLCCTRRAHRGWDRRPGRSRSSIEAVVETVKHAGAVGMRDIDGVDDVFAVGRNLAHEAETLLRVLFGEGTPAKQVVVGDGADFLDRDESVESLVVGGTIDVDAHRLAIAREGVAIAAGGQVGHHHLALRSD